MSRRGSLLAEIRGGIRLPGPDELPRLDLPDGDAPGDLKPVRWIERIELGVSAVFFLLMLLTLLIGVFWRYVLDDPLTWTVNLGAIAFLWVTLIGSGLPNWDDSHIQFDLAYRKLPSPAQRWARITGNLLIVVTFAMATPATLDYLQFLHQDKVTGLDITFDLAFGAVLIFFVATVLHRGWLLLIDLRSIGRPAEQGETPQGISG